jgi:hypothetical protein
MTVEEETHMQEALQTICIAVSVNLSQREDRELEFGTSNQRVEAMQTHANG